MYSDRHTRLTKKKRKNAFEIIIITEHYSIKVAFVRIQIFKGIWFLCKLKFRILILLYGLHCCAEISGGSIATEWFTDDTH